MSADGSRDGADDDDRGSGQVGTSKWEWMVAALGAAIVAAILTYMIYYGLTKPEGPPEIVLNVIETAPAMDGYRVRVGATNNGHSAAAGLIVAGELAAGSEVAEEAEATIDYLPEGSAREASFQFTLDPAGYDLRLRVKGFARP